MNNKPFSEKYKHLAWSNSKASPEVLLRQALLRTDFSILLEAAVELGVPALVKEWNTLLEGNSPEAVKAAPTTSRMVKHLGWGYLHNYPEDMDNDLLKPYAQLLNASKVKVLRS